MLTWANIFTATRVLIAPLFFYLLIENSQSSTRIAVLLFTIASLTDYFDGWVARKFGEVTELGNFLDPLADKVLVLSAFFAFVFLDIIQLWMVVVIIVRDVFTTLMRVNADMRRINVKTSRSAKWKTALQMIFVCLVLVLLAVSRSSELEKLQSVAQTLLYSDLIDHCMLALTAFTVYTLVEYAWTNRKLLKK